MYVQVAPSILAADFANLGRSVQHVTTDGADLIHADIMDGHFVPNLTFGAPVIASLKSYTQAPIDAHLMVQEPERMVAAVRAAGASIITVHAEACTHLQRTLVNIRELGAEAGVALNPATPETVLDYVMDDIDMVLVMTVNPGFGGQAFIPAMLHKIATVRKKLNDRGHRAVRIEVDGGINPVTAAACVKAGASVLVAGSFVFGAENPAEAIRQLRGK